MARRFAAAVVVVVACAAALCYAQEMPKLPQQFFMNVVGIVNYGGWNVSMSVYIAFDGVNNKAIINGRYNEIGIRQFVRLLTCDNGKGQITSHSCIPGTTCKCTIDPLLEACNMTNYLSMAEDLPWTYAGKEVFHKIDADVWSEEHAMVYFKLGTITPLGIYAVGDVVDFLITKWVPGPPDPKYFVVDCSSSSAVSAASFASSSERVEQQAATITRLLNSILRFK